MGKTARISKGATLLMGTAANSLTAIANIIEANEPGVQKDTQDATTHDDGDAEVRIAEGVYGLSEISLRINYIAGEAGEVALRAAALAVGPTALRYFKMNPRSATGTYDETFEGIVTSFQPSPRAVKGKQEATITIMPSDAMTRAATV